MRKFIKAASLLLALTLSLGLTAPAFAASPGEFITPFQYDSVSVFNNGYTTVSRDGKYGLLDADGNEFQFGVYDRIHSFNQGCAAVGIYTRTDFWLYHKWGFVDKTGRLVIPCELEDTQPPKFVNGVIRWKRDGKYGLLDTNGQEVAPFKYTAIHEFENGYAEAHINGKYGLLDTTGREVIPCMYDKIDHIQGSNTNRGYVKGGMVHVELNGKHGFANLNGEQVVACKYDAVSDFYGGYAAVGISTGETQAFGHIVCKWGIVNAAGQEVVPCQYRTSSSIPSIEYGVMLVTQNGKWGYINTAGKMIVPCKYEYAWDFINGMGTVRQNDKYGLFDATGKEVAPCVYSDVTSDSSGLWALQNSKGKYGYIDSTGKVVVPFQYDNANAMLKGHAYVSRNGKSGYIDATGKEIIPCKYDSTDSWVGFDDAKFLGVQLNGKWGFVDAAGTQLTPFKYDYVINYSYNWKGCIVVKLNDKYGIINASGKESAPCQYDSVDASDDGKYAVVKKDGKAGLVEVATGKEILPCVYESVYYPAEGRVAVRQGGKWAVACIGETFITELVQQAEKAKNDQTLSGWAKDEVISAIHSGLVPPQLWGFYSSQITREEFCRLMTTLVEKSTGKDIKSYAASKGLTITDPFTDTDSPEVLAAHALGIVNGTSDTTFNPKGSITRQEAAAMLARTGRLLGLASGQGVSFTDAGKFANWAGSEIAFVSGLVDPVSRNRVMNGVSSDRFDPAGSYTREQAIMTTLRLFHCAGK